MRSNSGPAATLLFCGFATAAEPAKVSVYPTRSVVEGTLVAPAPSPVLPGTLVAVRADDPKPPAKPQEKLTAKPMPQSANPPTPALVPPTVSAVTVSSCGACEATPCGTPLFRGRLFAASCGADVCESPGRPALLGGTFCKSSCSTCDSSCPHTRELLARLKSWLMFRPCEGPRIDLFRCEPYVSRSMTVFSGRGCDVGTCHAAGLCVGSRSRVGGGACAAGACDGSSCRGGFGRGAFASGASETEGCRGGMPAGLGSRLLGIHNRVPQDCNDCEPKLSGAKFDECYRFANAIPRTYGCRTTRINPIGGCVTPPGELVAKAEDKGNEPTRIERAAATLPAPHPLPPSRPATAPRATVTPVSAAGEVKATNPLKTPFSNP